MGELLNRKDFTPTNGGSLGGAGRVVEVEDAERNRDDGARLRRRRPPGRGHEGRRHDLQHLQRRGATHQGEGSG